MKSYPPNPCIFTLYKPASSTHSPAMKFSTILVALSCAVSAFAYEVPRDDSGFLEARDELDPLLER